jgi:2'-hydroxyisoflavone reductase
MRLLILGGTVFLGRHLVEAARARGHVVTLFNRGQHNPDLFPAVEKVRGDRDGGLDALRGRTWDATIDTSGRLPRVVRQSAALLAPAVGHYIFISTMSVYADLAQVGITENSPVGSLPDDYAETDTSLYGPLKAACEREVEAALPGRALILRPGLIVGPYDPTNRFTYWPRRIAAGGEVLVFGTPDNPIRFNIDARDLAEWTVRLAEAETTGTFNAQGPTNSLTMGTLTETCRTVSGSDPRFTWVDEEFLHAQGVRPWTELPLWLPRQMNAIHTARIDRALAAGLVFRPLAETVRDVLAWDRNLPPDFPRPNGLAPERERELLAAWHAQSGGGN